MRLLSLIALMATATPAHSGESVKAYYPEGPIVVGDALFYAEMHRDRVMAWRGDEREVFYRSAGCGPTAVAPYGEGFVVLCHLTNELHMVSQAGRLLKRIGEDGEGRAFNRPNDATADGAGGVYFSASGLFSPGAKATGAVNHVNAQGEARRLVTGLHYANGVHYDEARKLLFVSEHLGRRILSYRVIAPGRVGGPAVFANWANALADERGNLALAGPDGLETDKSGNLYAAFYGVGAVLVFAPDGALIERIGVPEKLVTNLTLSADERFIFVTGSKDGRRKPYPGAVRKLSNPIHED